MTPPMKILQGPVPKHVYILSISNLPPNMEAATSHPPVMQIPPLQVSHSAQLHQNNNIARGTPPQWIEM